MRVIILVLLFIGFLGSLGLTSLYCDEIDDLVPCIIQVESSGNANAYNDRSGAIGLMQITPIVLREYNERNHQEYLTCYEDGFLAQPIAYRKIDLYDSKVNKQVGTWYLHRLKNHYLKDKYTIERLLACYNGGYGKLRKVNFNVNKMPLETRQYIKKVMKLYKKG